MFSKINFDPIFHVLEEHMVVGTNGYLWPFKPIGTNGPRNYYIKSWLLTVTIKGWQLIALKGWPSPTYHSEQIIQEHMGVNKDFICQIFWSHKIH